MAKITYEEKIYSDDLTEKDKKIIENYSNIKIFENKELRTKIKYADRYKASIFSGKKCRHLQIAAMRTGAVAVGKNFECK